MELLQFKKKRAIQFFVSGSLNKFSLTKSDMKKIFKILFKCLVCNIKQIILLLHNNIYYILQYQHLKCYVLPL